MKKTTFQFLFMSALAALVLSACNKKDEGNTAYPDVYIQSKTVGTTTAYSVYQWVYSYNTMTSVESTDPYGYKELLDNYEDKGLSFSGETAYSTVKPIGGTYTFAVTFKNGEVVNYTNSITGTVIEPATNIVIEKKTDNGTYVKATWSKVTGAIAYQIVARKGSTEVVRTPLFTFNDASTTPTFGMDISLFTNQMPGTFTFEIVALKIETGDDSKYDAVSVATVDYALN